MLHDLLGTATCYNLEMQALTDYDALVAIEPPEDSRSNWRLRMLAFMAAERAKLLWLLLGLNEETLTKSPIFGDYTARDLLAHVAAWDDFYAERIEMVSTGRTGSITGVEADERNAMLHASHASWNLNQALAACTSARMKLLETLAHVPDEQLHRTLQLPWDDSYPLRDWVIWRARHDAAHAEDVRAWRQENGFTPAVGPKGLLYSALRASRYEMEALVELVPEGERATRKVTGAWSLKDTVGHVTDWEAYCLSCIKAGRQLPQEFEGDGQRWNEAHVAVRREQPWRQVWNDYHEVREQLLAILGAMSPDTLGSAMANPWGPQASPYGWCHSYLAHEREHTGHLREALLLH